MSLLLSKVYNTLQPTTFLRATATFPRFHSTHFLNDFMTSTEKGPIQLSMESKV
jgi:hypothetical protein